jgi:hypothetical protein
VPGLDDFLSRVWNDIASRPDGPFAFRFYLQPLTAIFFALRDGMKDSRTGRPAYLFALFTHPHERAEMIRDGWKSINRVCFIALAIDLLYQVVVLKRIFPGETLIIVFILAVLPYAFLRGPINRVAHVARRRPGFR